MSRDAGRHTGVKPERERGRRAGRTGAQEEKERQNEKKSYSISMHFLNPQAGTDLTHLCFESVETAEQGDDINV